MYKCLLGISSLGKPCSWAAYLLNCWITLSNCERWYQIQLKPYIGIQSNYTCYFNTSRSLLVVLSFELLSIWLLSLLCHCMQISYTVTKIFTIRVPGTSFTKKCSHAVILLSSSPFLPASHSTAYMIEFNSKNHKSDTGNIEVEGT